jgi:hypothetical protein
MVLDLKGKIIVVKEFDFVKIEVVATLINSNKIVEL